MTTDEIRALLDERFGPLAEVMREGRRMTPWREAARRRRTLTEMREEA